MTFLFTDIEGSSRLWELHPGAMGMALASQQALITASIERHGGVLVKRQGEGDSAFAVFARATNAAAAAIALQQALLAEPWPAEAPLRVRIALHTGEAELRDGDYYGPAVNRCARLRAAAHGGQVLLSRTTADLVRDALPEGSCLLDLGEQRLRDLTRPEQIFQLTDPTLPADFPPLNTLDARPNNLPEQLTPLLGREQEVMAVRDLLRSDRGRLVTLTGPGGTGKTRLALQVAAELLDDFAHGVCFVDLAPLADPGLVASAVARALDVREVGGTPLLESLKAFLHRKKMLLVLDNFEQLLEAAPVVTDLLTRAPGLKVVVTSRAALRLRGEQEYPVPPLALPPLVDGRWLMADGPTKTKTDPSLPESLTINHQLSTISQYAATELFVQRATAVRPGFLVTNETAPVVAAICARLDGLPLAIELAAARIKLFGPQTLLSRLESTPLRLLTDGARDLPRRQRSLRDAIAWSYDLLGVEEQRLFERLSVFVGGCTLEAVEAVCAAVDPQMDADEHRFSQRASVAPGHLRPSAVICGSTAHNQEAADRITTLIDNSLLRREEGPDGEPRFRMLETIREFGRERLAASGAEVVVQEQHARFFLALAEAAEPELGVDPSWLERLELEHDNLRAALDWCTAAGARGQGPGVRESEPPRRTVPALTPDPWPLAPHELGLRLAGALGRFWAIRNHRAEGCQRLAAALAGSESAPAAVRAKILYRQANFAILEGNHEGAAPLGEASLALFQEAGDQRGTADALVMLAVSAFNSQAPGWGVALAAEGLALHQEIGNRRGAARALAALGNGTFHRGARERGLALLTEALALGRAGGDRLETAYTLRDLGFLEGWMDHAELAVERFVESLTLFREFGDQGMSLWTLVPLAWAARSVGDHERVSAVLDAGLAASRGLEGHGRTAAALVELADVARLEGDPRKAKALFEEGLAVAREQGNEERVLHHWLAEAARRQGDHGTVKALYEKHLARARASGDEQEVSHSFNVLADMALAEGDLERARALIEEARALGPLKVDLMRQGHLMLEMGDVAAGRSLYEETLSLRRARGEMANVAWALVEVGHAAWLQGEHEVTQQNAVEALGLFQEQGNTEGILAVLESLGVAALAQEKKERAARLMGAAEALREARRLPGPEWWQRPRRRMGDAVRAASLQQEFAAAWEAGRAFSLDEAVQEALEATLDA